MVRKTGGGLWHSMTSTEIIAKFRKFIQMKHIRSSNMAISRCPEECFDSAFREFLRACKITKSLSASNKKNKGKGFAYPDQLKYKTKKRDNSYIDIRGKFVTYDSKAQTLSFYENYFTDSHFHIKTDLTWLGIEKFKYSLRLCVKNGQYFFMIPHASLKQAPIPSSKVCSLDPGVRTFQTGYDPEGLAFEISPNQASILHKKRKIEALQSDLEGVSSKRARRVIKKRIRSLYAKITNCVKDLHHKSSRILVDSYEEVVLPKFNSSKMLKKGERTIDPKTAYLMQTLSHYTFRELLHHKMEAYGRKLILCTEEYTSKTCGRCGKLNHDLGSDKVFVCPHHACRFVADRDINAARNIFIKNYY